MKTYIDAAASLRVLLGPLANPRGPGRGVQAEAGHLRPPGFHRLFIYVR